MATYVPPKRATAFRCYVMLRSQADTKLFQVNPTLASGDVKVSKDGGAFANLTTLPAVTPSGGRAVQVDLSATEMTADQVIVQFVDAAGAEWCDLALSLQTSARQIDDLAFPATSGRSMVVDAAGLVDANTVKVGPSGSGTAQTARDIGASVLLSSGTGTGQLDFTSGVVKANTTQIAGSAVSTSSAQIGVNVVSYASGQAPLQPTTAGRTLDVTATGEAGIDWSNIGAPTTTVNLSGTTIKAVTDAVGANVTSINSVSTSSVTTVNANIGTTQPTNYTGTGASALVKADTVDIAGSAVSTSSAQIGVNVVNAGGTAWGSGAITAGSIASNAITAAKIATDAIGAAQLAADAVTEIWNEQVDGTVTARQSLRLANSANGGILAGAATTNVTVRDLANTKNRIDATVDANGNRTAVTRDLT